MPSFLLWSFQPLPELGDQVGFVECDEALARELIGADKAQDPAVGGLALRPIETAPRVYEDEQLAPGEDYQTTQLKARRKRSR